MTRSYLVTLRSAALSHTTCKRGEQTGALARCLDTGGTIVLPVSWQGTSGPRAPPAGQAEVTQHRTHRGLVDGAHTQGLLRRRPGGQGAAQLAQLLHPVVAAVRHPA